MPDPNDRPNDDDLLDDENTTPDEGDDYSALTDMVGSNDEDDEDQDDDPEEADEEEADEAPPAPKQTANGLPAGRWVAFHPEGRESIVYPAQVISSDGIRNLLDVPAAPPHSITAVRQEVPMDRIVHVFPEGEPKPVNITRTSNDGLDIKPWFNHDGAPHVLGTSRLQNKPEGNSREMLKGMWEGNDLTLVFYNRMPAVLVTMVVRDVMDVEAVNDWLVGPTARTCAGPRIYASTKTPGVRLLRDSRWDPFAIKFAGAWSVSTSRR